MKSPSSTVQTFGFSFGQKCGDDYSVVMGWLRCSLLLSLLHSAIQCICEARLSIEHYAILWI